MKYSVLFLITVLFNLHIFAQNKDFINVQNQVKSLMDYFDEYDPIAPESVRKASFNNYINKVNPNLSNTDRKKAYKIVNAYILADKGQNVNIDVFKEDQKIIENLLQNSERKKQLGEKAMFGEFSRIKQLSYLQYKAFITQNGQVPLEESDIRKAYNTMHKKDGKEVAINVKTAPKTSMEKQIQAFNILQNPHKHTFKEFRNAMLYLKPSLSKTEIQEAWKKSNK